MNIGDRIGDYEIVEILGQGGMGQVYKVKNVLSERIEAMKVLLPNMEGDSDLAERFLREIKVQAAFDHPNIAKLYTALRSSNQLLMVMEYVEGVSLEKMLAKGPLLVGEAVNYAGQVLDALGYAHGRGVVHRDIKPANIMITPSGNIKLLDFGIAHMSNSNLTQVGTTVGSLFYMSPEQVKGGPADPRSDLYSLGIVLYEMVTGKRPFTGDSASAIMTAHLQQTPVAPNDMVPWVLGPLNEIILMAVAKDTQARFQSAAAFRNALQNVAVKEIDQAKTQVMAAKTTPLPVVQPNVVQPSSTQPTPVVPSAISGPSVAPQRVPIAAAAASAPAILGATQPEIAAAPLSQSPQPSAPMTTPSPADSYALPNFAGPSQPAVQPPSSRRGLYMALGSIVTLAVIAAAAIEGPKFLRTHAAGNPSKATVQDAAPPPSQPVPSPAPIATASPQNVTSTETVPPQTPGQPVPNSTQPESTTAPAASSTTATTAPRQPASTSKKLASANNVPAIPNRVQTPSSAQPQQTAQPNSQQLTEVRRDYNDLAIRANSAKESLRSIKEQMSRQGLGLRSDVREAETRMTYLLNEAKDKLKNGDAEGAKHDLEMAQLAVAQVEKFLGH